MKIEGAFITVLFIGSLLLNLGALLSYGSKYLKKISNEDLDRNTILNPYWQDKVNEYEILNQQERNCVFLVGDSMFDRLNIEKFFNKHDVRNRGIGYDNTKSLMHRLRETVINGKPEKVFLYIGGNDLSKIKDVELIVLNTSKIIDEMMRHGIDVCFISLLPKGKTYESSYRKVEDINKDTIFFNSKLKEKCLKNRVQFIDITKYFITKDCYLDDRWTSDEIHLNASGVQYLAQIIEQYI